MLGSQTESCKMAIFYGYTNAIFGTQATVNGSAFDFAFAPTTGGDFQWTGTTTNFAVQENDGATTFNGDSIVNEEVDPDERFGGTWQQTVNIDGTDQQVIWDYTFEITGSDGTVLRVAVIDVDLNNDNDLNDTISGDDEDGYYLIFPDGMPTAGVDYTIGGIVENDAGTGHIGLGGQVVCFVAGTMIETPTGLRDVGSLKAGDLVMTQDNGAQPLVWVGARTVAAQGHLAPIVIGKGALENKRELAVSPQHRMVITDWRAEMLFGEPEVFISAQNLIDGDRVYRRTGGMVTYHHIMFAGHEIVFAEGAASESFQPGVRAVQALDDAPRAELLELFPELCDGSAPRMRGARRTLKWFEAACLTRH
jgi:hypothetical protein